MRGMRRNPPAVRLNKIATTVDNGSWWNGDPAVEARVKEETKATIRVIPDAEFRSAEAPTTCIVTGEPAKYEVVWAKAY